MLANSEPNKPARPEYPEYPPHGIEVTPEQRALVMYELIIDLVFSGHVPHADKIYLAAEEYIFRTAGKSKELRDYRRKYSAADKARAGLGRAKRAAEKAAKKPTSKKRTTKTRA